MKEPRTALYPILFFILAQLAWFLLLGMWIYWYVTNYLLITKVGEKIAPRFLTDTSNLVTLIGGLILLVILSLTMSLIFGNLNRQINLTHLYDTFIANITHELKSPLSSIQLYLETMRIRNVPRAKQAEFIDIMLSDIDRLDHLISSVLYLSALERRGLAKKPEHEYHVSRADSVLHELLDEAAAYFKLPPDRLTIEGEAPCSCIIDRSWFRIVIDNLFDNAIKYSEGPAQIRVKMSCNPRYVYVDFSDNGIGIARRDQKKIFHKFERIQNPQSPSVKGTGLGLYWVKEIIRYHGGKIGFHSEGIGQGTSFTIALPVYSSRSRHRQQRLLRFNERETERQ